MLSSDRLNEDQQGVSDAVGTGNYTRVSFRSSSYASSQRRTTSRARAMDPLSARPYEPTNLRYQKEILGAYPYLQQIALFHL